MAIDSVYSVTDLIKKLKIENKTSEYNLTTIADSYVAIEIDPQSLQNIELINAPEILISDVEIRAKKSIDRKRSISETRQLEAVAIAEKRMIESRAEEFASILSEIA